MDGNGSAMDLDSFFLDFSDDALNDTLPYLWPDACLIHVNGNSLELPMLSGWPFPLARSGPRPITSPNTWFRRLNGTSANCNGSNGIASGNNTLYPIARLAFRSGSPQR